MRSIFSLNQGNYSFQMTRNFGYVGIEPVGDLSQTANILGEILGEIDFVQDFSGKFDEYPAFIGQDGEIEFALLGVPDPLCDVRAVPNKDYQLMAYPIGNSSGEEMDISLELIERISKDGRIYCWDLKS